MLVKLENPLLFTRVIEIISELVTEVRIKVNSLGLSITAIDPANVSMVRFLLPRDSFSVFETDEEVLGINLENFKKILKRCGTGSSLVLEKKDSFLNIQIHDRITRNFNLSLIDIESEEKEMPNLEYTAIVELNSNDFIDSIEDCIVVSDSCAFIVENGKFLIEARSLNSAMSEFSGDEAKIQAENCKAKYSLEYLQKFIKAAKLSEKVVLSFADDHPLKMDIKNDFLELSFLLAPRVETED
ncbi:MAG: DNA polymerase III sliding clamp [Candidatus Pacearchaeota archaeon]|nr:MAG: DNA polymerase III sliding clamp [Candidatus Pacearchaeota archaeon]